VILAALAMLLVYAAVTVTSSVLGTLESLPPSAVQPYLLSAGLAAAVAALYGLRAYKGAKRLFALQKQIHATRLGLRGEQAVAEALNSHEVTGLGYFTFHDVPCDNGGNIGWRVVAFADASLWFTR
jgi:hypothetical protein